MWGLVRFLKPGDVVEVLVQVEYFREGFSTFVECIRE